MHALVSDTYGADDFRARVWGEALYPAARYVLSNFGSDLYRDMQALPTFINDDAPIAVPVSYYYVVRPSGTTLTTSQSLAYQAATGYEADASRSYVLTVLRSDADRWVGSMSRVVIPTPDVTE